jgi:hypothetical protein
MPSLVQALRVGAADIVCPYHGNSDEPRGNKALTWDESRAQRVPNLPLPLGEPG